MLLADQDRSLWSRELIAEGQALVARAFAGGEVGPYAIQGAIAAVHCAAETDAATNWSEIAGLYDLLLQALTSAVVRLNRAVALFMAEGPRGGSPSSRRCWRRANSTPISPPTPLWESSICVRVARRRGRRRSSGRWRFVATRRSGEGWKGGWGRWGRGAHALPPTTSPRA